MRRGLFNLLAAASLLYLVADVARASITREASSLQSFHYSFLRPPVRYTSAAVAALSKAPAEDHALLGFHWGRSPVIGPEGVGIART